jgi:hypothetical protein
LQLGSQRLIGLRSAVSIGPLASAFGRGGLGVVSVVSVVSVVWWSAEVRSVMKRFVPLSIATCLLGAAAIACGTEAEVIGSHSIAVQPRVVVDGMVELGAVAAGVADASLVIDEVLFHAPVVHVRQGDADVNLATWSAPSAAGTSAMPTSTAI